MINKSSDILFSNELESELGLTLRSHEGAMYDGEQIHARISEQKRCSLYLSVNPSLLEKLSKSRVREVF